MGEIFIVIGAILFFAIRGIYRWLNDYMHPDISHYGRTRDEGRYSELQFMSKEELNELYKSYTGSDYDWEAAGTWQPIAKCAYDILTIENKWTVSKRPL